MRRRTTQDKRTLIPPFDPKEIEREAHRTIAPAYDPSSYARIVDHHVSVQLSDAKGEQVEPPAPCETVPATSRTASYESRESRPGPPPTIAAPVLTVKPDASAEVVAVDLDDPDTVNRAMYGCYLASAFPEALALAERVLAYEPEHSLAKFLAERCRERILPKPRTLAPSSVLRLRLVELERQARHIDARTSFVLGHIDGISDAQTVASLTGLPAPEALDRLHALLDLGIVELVSA